MHDDVSNREIQVPIATMTDVCAVVVSGCARSPDPRRECTTPVAPVTTPWSTWPNGEARSSVKRIYGGTNGGDYPLRAQENIKRQWWRSVRLAATTLSESICRSSCRVSVWVASWSRRRLHDPLVESLITHGATGPTISSRPTKQTRHPPPNGLTFATRKPASPGCGRSHASST